MLVRSGLVVVGAAAAVALSAPHADAAQSYRAHWALDEIGGNTAVDSSGNGNDGTSFNVVGDGDGYSFNGTSSRVVVPELPDPQLRVRGLLLGRHDQHDRAADAEW